MKIKSLFLILSINFIVPASKAQKIRTLFYDDILLGKVKVVAQNDYMAGTSLIEIRDTTWYDENGKTLENHTKTMRGAMFKDKYVYTKDLSKTKMQVIGSETDQNINGTLNDKGNLTEYVSYFKRGSLNFRGTYEYDNKDNLITYCLYDNSDRLKQKRSYEYDKDDKLVHEYLWDKYENTNYEINFEYSGFDEKGNWLKRIGHRKLPSGKSMPDLIVTREIAYY